uniref:Ephrin-A3a n=1 Tax=Seriola dumerili TaxID=41447 RepID=A0A3B4VHC8_SERDU
MTKLKYSFNKTGSLFAATFHVCFSFFFNSPSLSLFLYLSVFLSRLRREGYTVQVSVNDYLDIYCPHYNTTQRGTLERVVAEQYILYMVSYRGYRTCDPQLGFKRWECNRPHAPHAPIKFSEKFQRYSAFSLGYEFNVGQEYYYICKSSYFSSQLPSPTCIGSVWVFSNRFWRFSWGQDVAQLLLCSFHG